MKKSERKIRFDGTDPDEVNLRREGPPPEPADYCPTAGKTMHATERDAERVAAHQMAGGSPPLRTYFCLYCQHWHLTKAD